MRARNGRPVVVVIGPLGDVGGMATAARAQVTGPLAEKYHFVPFDNSKRTPPGRTLWQGLRAQLSLVSQLRQLLHDHRPQIVHIHTCSGLSFYRTVIDMVLAKLYGGRTLLHIRGGRFGEFLRQLPRSRRWLVRTALISADGVIALSPSWARRLWSFDRRIRVHVVQNGARLPARGKQWRRTVSTKMVFVGTLDRAKGVDDLIEALALFPPALRDVVHVRVIGPDPQHRAARLQARINAVGLQAQVSLVGPLDHAAVQEELRRSSIFVLPSHSEGLPNALLEAMACGVPAVVSGVGAVPEVVRDGVEGLLIEPGNQVQLAGCLQRLVCEPHLCRELGRAARKRVRRQFSEQVVCGLLDELYGAVLGTSGTG